jgi:ABC-type sugar transport system ATPase subunit
MRDETEKVLQHLNLDLDPMMPVSDLSVGEQQMVEIARALSRDSRIIVMDEPTAALTEREGRGPVPHRRRPEGARSLHHLCHPSPA